MTYTTFMEKTAPLTDQEFAAMLEAEGFAVTDDLFAEPVTEGTVTRTSEPLAF